MQSGGLEDDLSSVSLLECFEECIPIGSDEIVLFYFKIKSHLT